MWGVLTGQAYESISNLVAREVREIETWILRLLSAPVSIPGKTKVLVRRKCFFPIDDQNFCHSDRHTSQ